MRRLKNLFGIKHDVTAPKPETYQSDMFLVNGDNNQVIIVYNDGHQAALTRPLDGLKIHINGNNNIIKLPETFGVQNSFLDINSDGLYLEIEPTIWFHNVWLRSYAGINQYVHIGRDTSFEQAHITVADEAKLVIGNDCMFSCGINVWAVDGHSILDMDGNCINYNNGQHCLEIGNHVWVGEGARITKGAKIYDNSIVGASAVACRDYSSGGGNNCRKSGKNYQRKHKLVTNTTIQLYKKTGRVIPVFLCYKSFNFPRYRIRPRNPRS